MFLVYAEDHFHKLAEVFKQNHIKYTLVGKVFLIRARQDELIQVLSNLPEELLPLVKIATAEEEELKKPESLLNVGFRAISLHDYLEKITFQRIYSILAGVEIYFQAIISRQDASIYGFEALCRNEVPVWKLFKVSDRVAHITDYYCRERALLEYMARFPLGRYHLFLNFHPRFLRDPIENVGELEANLAMKGIDPRWVVVEVDEYEGMHVKALRMIRDFLKSAGIKLALDDVGAGYSGLYQLVEIHPDIAKLDMELIRDVHENKLKQAVLKGIVKACKDSGIVVLAEGVEKREELEFLLELEVDLFQGFLFARPDPHPPIKEIRERAYNLLSNSVGGARNEDAGIRLSKTGREEGIQKPSGRLLERENI